MIYPLILFAKLKSIVEGNPNWDGRVQNIQVTDSKEWYKEVRILVSSADSSKNWDLRVEVRENDRFHQRKIPGSFAKLNIEPTPSEKIITGE